MTPSVTRRICPRCASVGFSGLLNIEFDHKALENMRFIASFVKIDPVNLIDPGRKFPIRYCSEQEANQPGPHRHDNSCSSPCRALVVTSKGDYNRNNYNRQDCRQHQVYEHSAPHSSLRFNK